MYTGTGTYVAAGEGMVGIALSAGVVSVDSDPGEGGASMAGSGSAEGAFSGLGEGMVAIEGEEGICGLGPRTTGEGKAAAQASVSWTRVDVAWRTGSGDGDVDDLNRDGLRTDRARGDVRLGEGSGETSSVPNGTRSVGASRGAANLASWAKLFGGGVGGTVVARDMIEGFLDRRAGRGLSSSGSTNGSSLFGCWRCILGTL
jgi:hypothetical protein